MVKARRIRSRNVFIQKVQEVLSIFSTGHLYCIFTLSQPQYTLQFTKKFFQNIRQAWIQRGERTGLR